MKGLRKLCEVMLSDADMGDVEKKSCLSTWIRKLEDGIMSTPLHSSELKELTKDLEYLQGKYDAIKIKENE